VKQLLAVILAASLPGCFSLCSLLPPLPAGECTTFVDITALVATDAGTAQVTLGCNQGSVSACDGGELPACPTSACVEVDWVSVAANFNGNCSGASPAGLAAAVTCTSLPGDAGVTLSFVEVTSVPAPEIVYAHPSDGGSATSCDADCAGAASTCMCDAALGGTTNQSCTFVR
jgi:hypothetical protein